MLQPGSIHLKLAVRIEDHKISVRATTGTSGNATLEFSIPRQVQAEEGDLTVGVKSGLVARSVERSVEFRARS